MNVPEDPRRLLLAGYRAALDAVGGRESVRRRLAAEGAFAPRFVFAVGKAAAYMAAGAFDVFAGRIERGIVVTKHGHAGGVLDPGWPVEVVESSHPVPDASCLAAGRALVDFIDAVPADADVLSLVSGGASALVEVLPDGFDASDLARVNEYLLAAGHPIGAMNRVRKRISRIKGGRLAQRIAPRRALNLAISDVPGDDPKVIGSGMLVAHSCEDLAVDGLDLPPWLVEMGRRAPPLAGEAAAAHASAGHVRTEVIARPAAARAAAASVCRAAGIGVVEHPDLLEGDAIETGRRIGREIAEAKPVAHVWASETTVMLPANPGRGGRCQSLALAAAVEIGRCAGGPRLTARAGDERVGVAEGHRAGGPPLTARAGEGADVCVLAAGTDGTDGPGEDAGALVDAGTIARGAAAGLDPERSLRAADAGTFLEASGDLVRTGPTGTNVMDLVIAMKVGPD